MSAQAWFIIAVIGFSFAGIFLITAIFMFIKMNIPAILGDLSGKTVAREIKAMRESNASSGDKRFRPSAVNRERGTLTESVSVSAEAQKAMHASKRLDNTSGASYTPTPSYSIGGEATDVLSDSNATEVLTDANATEVLTDSNATEVLTDSNATEVLTDSNATEVLTDSNATEVLTDPNATVVLSNELPTVGGTTVLSNTEELEIANEKPVVFNVVRSEMLIHSDEEI